MTTNQFEADDGVLYESDSDTDDWGLYEDKNGPSIEKRVEHVIPDARIGTGVSGTTVNYSGLVFQLAGEEPSSAIYAD